MKTLTAHRASLDDRSFFQLGIFADFSQSCWPLRQAHPHLLNGTDSTSRSAHLPPQMQHDHCERLPVAVVLMLDHNTAQAARRSLTGHRHRGE